MGIIGVGGRDMAEERCELCGWWVRAHRTKGICDLTEDYCGETDWCTYFIEGETVEALEERDRAN